MQFAHLTSAASFWADSGGAWAAVGKRDRQAWSAARGVGLLGPRALFGPPWTWKATPPPGGVVGSGKLETPRPRIHSAQQPGKGHSPLDLARYGAVKVLLAQGCRR